MNIVHTPNHYLIILDGVPHGELIPLHLPSFSAFMRDSIILGTSDDIFLDI